MALMMLKKDNDQLREGLNFVIQGGSPSQLQHLANDISGSFNRGSDMSLFKSPKNAFILESEDNNTDGRPAFKVSSNLNNI